MEIVVVKMLFIVAVSGQFGKHVHVKHEYTWHEAQQYCRDVYTDLSPITSPQDEERLKMATNGKVVGRSWIGLYLNATKWKWSGGGDATNILWGEKQPNLIGYDKVVSVCLHTCRWKGFHDTRSYRTMTFFCFNLIVPQFKKTWEQAMLYCTQEHNALTSLNSETEHLLALSEIKHSNITERVWIGLRFLEDRWLWVNGDSLEYKAWPQSGDQDHECPIQKRCGALTKEGVWENWECWDKLNFICY